MAKTRGFSLIELLVVIAIISIVAAILFPVFASAREKSRQISCASNMRQLGMAFQEYTQDNDELLPVSRIGQLSRSGVMWAGPIYPYVKNFGVFQCPDDPLAPQTVTYNGVAVQLGPVSYAYNSNLMGLPSSTSFPGFGVLGATQRLNSPVKTVMLCEITASGFPTGGIQSLADLASPNEIGGYATSHLSPGAQQGGISAGTPMSLPLATGPLGMRGDPTTYPPARHTGGANYLLCDGHVKWLKAGTVSTGNFEPGVETATSCQDQDYFQEAAGTECLGSWAATFSPL